MGTIMTAVAWAGLVVCAAVAVSGFRLMARTEGGWREAPMWDGPLVFTSAAFALLAFLGFLPPFPGAFLVLVPLLVIAATAAGAWRALAAADGKAGATRRVLAGIAGHVLGTLREARTGLPVPGGGPHRADPGDGQTASVPGPAVPVRSGPGPVRTVPPVRYDAVIGPAPHPADVAQGLESAGVEVPPPWAAVAEWTRSFEPDTEEDLLEHEAGVMAGILTWAEAEMAKAENLASGNGLDPVYIAGHFEFADEVAALASFKALLGARYKALYGSIRDDVDNGLILPENARKWFGADGPAQGGQAA